MGLVGGCVAAVLPVVLFTALLLHVVRGVRMVVVGLITTTLSLIEHRLILFLVRLISILRILVLMCRRLMRVVRLMVLVLRGLCTSHHRHIVALAEMLILRLVGLVVGLPTRLVARVRLRSSIGGGGLRRLRRMTRVVLVVLLLVVRLVTALELWVLIHIGLQC